MTQTAQWHSYELIHWRRHLAPIAVWLAASAGTGWLFTHRAQRCELVGIARGEQRHVASLVDGRLLIVPVRQFEQVKQGQTLAVLEDDRIRAELATAAAEAARLRAELATAEIRLTAEAQSLEAEQMAEARRFAVDLEKTRIRGLELRATIQTDRIALEFLRFRTNWLAGLHEKRAVSEFECRSATTRYAALNRKIEENEEILAQLQLDLERIQTRRERFATHHPVPPALEKTLEPLRAMLIVQERRMDELSLERSMLVLRSPLDGVVRQVLRGPGEVLLAGEPILTIAAPQPSEIIGYATAAQADQLDVHTIVQLEVAREVSPRRLAESHVVAVGPAVEQLPTRLWQNPAVPEWGWPVRIAIAAELGIRAGELVGIRQP